MSLRARLALLVASTFAVVVVGCVFAAHVSASRQLRNETDRFLVQRANDLAHGPGRGGPRPRPGGDGDGGPSFGGTIPAQASLDAVTQFIDHDGTVHALVADQPQLPVDAADRAIASSGSEHARLQDVTVNGTSYRMITAPLPSGGAVQVARSVQETNNVLSSLDLRLFFIALAGTLLAGALAWLIARRIVRPVEQLTVATERVAQTQDLSQHIDVDRKDELGRLAGSFNTMLTALGASREQQRRLVMDASHELRTPLTALRTNFEMLQRSPNLDPAQRGEVLDAAGIELVELTDLVGELVDLATDARAEEPLHEVDLGELVGRVVERQRRRTDHEITYEAAEPAVVNVRVGAIERAVSNLVDNACKFSPPGTSVDVRVHAGAIEVADRGPGIEPGDREHVFDRFYRAPAARTTPGSGLGLAIVRQIADLHGARVELAPRAGGGTTARFELPLSPAGSPE